MVQLNEEGETPREKSPGLADALKRRMSLNVGSDLKNSALKNMTLDYEEFGALDEKIRKGEATEEEEVKFRPMAEKFASEVVANEYKLSSVEQEKLWR